MSTPIARIHAGSRLFGTASELSDTDISTIYIPSARSILLGQVNQYDEDGTTNPASKNTPGDIDHKNYDLLYFMNMLRKATPDVLELLFAPDDLHIIAPDPTWKELQSIKEKLICSYVGNFKYLIKKNSEVIFITEEDLEAAYRLMGAIEELLQRTDRKTKLRPFAYGLIEKTNAPLTVSFIDKSFPDGKIEEYLKIANKVVPLDESLGKCLSVVESVITSKSNHKNEIDLKKKQFKMLYHAARLSSEAIELLNTGEITFPRPDRVLLSEIKSGKIPISEITEILNQLTFNFELARTKTSLPPTPDEDAIETFVARVHSEAIINSFNMASVPNI